MLYAGLVLIPEVVKPQAVALLVHDRTQSVLELSALCGINEHSLAIFLSLRLPPAPSVFTS